MPPKFSREMVEKVIFPDQLEYQPRTSPCEANCPAGNPIQKAHALIKENRTEEALEYLRCRNPFPGITGRVCAHPCEQTCNRKEYDEALSIRALERFAADHADMTRVARPKKRKDSGKRVAIIGSGPAGLACAYFSALLGHDVTVFEAAPVLGGIPRMAVPDFRLPKDVVDREVGQILEAGVHARTNTAVGRDIGFDEIRRDFDACLIAVGTWQDRRLDAPGVEFALPAVSFLRQVALGRRDLIGKTVVIMGGGGVAFDCAFTAKRLGASGVHVVCVEGEENMCASTEDLAQAKAEGVTIHNSRMISKVLHDGEKTTGIECFQISSFEFDEKGDLSVRPASSERNAIHGDTVISAVGVLSDLDFLGGSERFTFTPKGMLEVDPSTLATSVGGVFAAGDVATGPSTVARAIGSGRRAAIAINRFLGDVRTTNLGLVRIGGEGTVVVEDGAMESEPHVVTYEEIMNIDYFEKRERRTVEKISPSVSLRSLEEIERGLKKEHAVTEAARCFHCGHCTSCGCCVEDCAGLILAMDQDGPRVAYDEECWHCGCCRIACPSGAISYEFPLNMLV
jgi:formate dehydrogenase beta subunit